MAAEDDYKLSPCKNNAMTTYGQKFLDSTWHMMSFAQNNQF